MLGNKRIEISYKLVQASANIYVRHETWYFWVSVWGLVWKCEQIAAQYGTAQYGTGMGQDNGAGIAYNGLFDTRAQQGTTQYFTGCTGTGQGLSKDGQDGLRSVSVQDYPDSRIEFRNGSFILGSIYRRGNTQSRIVCTGTVEECWIEGNLLFVNTCRPST